MTNSVTFSRRAILAMPLVLAACKTRKQVIEIVGYSMGTTYRVVAVDHANILDEAQVKDAITSALVDVNKSMSNWDDSSEISRFNAANADTPMAVSADLAKVMQTAADVSRASDGRFDTTIGPLIELWGFGAPGTQDMPSEAAIAQARAKTGLSGSLLIGSDSLQKSQPDTQVYLAGIGKGFGADHVGHALAGLGLTDYMVEIGGDIFAQGRNRDGLPWQIGVESPNTADRGVLAVVGLSGLGMASSGDYRNYFEADGQRYSHLIDPATGRPVTHNTALATVLADNAMLADAWSTAMLILGRARGLEIAAQHGIAVQFVDRDASAPQLQFKTHTSARFDALTA